MRKIDAIVIHCSATRVSLPVTVRDIDSWHRARGFKKIGYHYVIYMDGSVNPGRPVEEVGAHAEGHNATSVGICYVGGLDDRGRPADTRTPEQKIAIRTLVNELKGRYPQARTVVGHRDLSPDKNGNGVIEKWEWLKECPCFDVKTEL